MKIIKLIAFCCVVAHFQVDAMNNNSNISNIQEFANGYYKAGMDDALRAIMPRVLEIGANSHEITRVANNRIIAHKFAEKRLRNQLNAANSDCRYLRTQLHTSENIRDAFRNRIQEQDATIEALTNQHNAILNQRNAALHKIQRMQQAQWYALGSAAMITVVDPIEKQYLMNTTGLSSGEVDDKMISERLFLLSALALCHPITAAIVATSAAAIKAQQYFQKQ